MEFWHKFANILSLAWRYLLIGWMFYLVFANELKSAFIILLLYLLLSTIDKVG